MSHFSYSVYIVLKFQLKSTPCSSRTQFPKIQSTWRQYRVCHSSPLRRESEMDRTFVGLLGVAILSAVQSGPHAKISQVCWVSCPHFEYKILWIYNLPMPQRTSLETNVVLSQFWTSSTVLFLVQVEVEVKLRPTFNRPVCLGVRHSSGTQDQFFFLLEIFFRQLRVCYFIETFLTRGRVCNLLYNCFCPLPV
jgi:hypothetical protein